MRTTAQRRTHGATIACAAPPAAPGRLTLSTAAPSAVSCQATASEPARVESDARSARGAAGAALHASPKCGATRTRPQPGAAALSPARYFQRKVETEPNMMWFREPSHWSSAAVSAPHRSHRVVAGSAALETMCPYPG